MNLDKCLRALDVCDGVVREVTDQEILDAKAQVGAGGLGCEPASAASVAGREAAGRAKASSARRARRLHPHRPSAQGPDRHGRLSHDRSGTVQQGARQPRREAGRVRQSRRGGAQRSGRDHQGDSAVQLDAAWHAIMPRLSASASNCHRTSPTIRIAHSRRRRPHGPAADRPGQRRRRAEDRRRARTRRPSASWARTPALIAGVGPLGVPLSSDARRAGRRGDRFFGAQAARRDPGRLCLAKKIPLVVATTGLDAEQQASDPRGRRQRFRSCGRRA